MEDLETSERPSQAALSLGAEEKAESRLPSGLVSNLKPPLLLKTEFWGHRGSCGTVEPADGDTPLVRGIGTVSCETG